MLVVSFISALRLLGIFLILPIFSAYVVRYPSATIPLAGVAFGVYALSQCLFQVPLGWASDRWGRRPVLVAGLAMFAAGSLACALARDIYELILARAIQGGGAVGSVALAALADLTRSTVRTQAFTITGIAVGGAFMLGILGGPILAARVGIGGLFYILGGLGVLATILAALTFPRGDSSMRKERPLPIGPMLADASLRRIFVAAFVLSLALNMFFFTYPLSWTDLGLDRSQLWRVYLVIFLPSAAVIFPYMRRAENRGTLRLAALIGWIAATGGYAAYLFGAQYDFMLYVSGAAFFLGYSLFQPILPAFLTQRIPALGRGTATGLYTFFGFIGSSLGGMLAGALIRISPSLPELFGFLILVAWYFFGLPEPPESGS